MQLTASDLIESLPTKLNKSDCPDLSIAPMPEVVMDSSNLSATTRRRKLILENTGNPALVATIKGSK